MAIFILKQTIDIHNSSCIKHGANLIIPTMSLIIARLDISTLLSTNKKPCRESDGVFDLLNSTSEDHERSE